MGDVCQRGREQLCNVSLWHARSVSVLKWAGHCRQTGNKTDRHVCVFMWDYKVFLWCPVCHPTKMNKICIAEKVTCRLVRQVNRQAGNEGVSDRPPMEIKEEEL